MTTCNPAAYNDVVDTFFIHFP